MPIRTAEALRHIVPIAYEAALDPRRWPDLAHAVGRATGAPRVGVGAYVFTGPPSVVGGHEWPVDFLERAMNLKEHPFMTKVFRCLAGPEGAVFTDHTVWPGGLFKAPEIHEAVTKPLDVDTFAAVPLGADPRGGGYYLGLMSGWTHEAHLADADPLMKALSPHLARALAVNRLFEQDRDALNSAWEFIGTAVILVDIQGMVVLANAGARRLLAEGDGVAIRKGMLSTASPAATAKLYRMIREAGESLTRGTGAAGGAMNLPRRSGLEWLRASVSPLVPDNPWHDGSRRAAAIVWIDDPQREGSTPSSALMKVFGLTPAEARVALALASGLAPAEVAERHQVSVRTIRSQIEAIHAKLGVRRQAQMVGVVLREEAKLDDPDLPDDR